jgi:hypothetical protein
MTKKTCSIQGCTKPVACRGWCGMHYMRYWKHGDVNTVVKDIASSTDMAVLRIRFESKFAINDVSGCWVWHGTTKKPFMKYPYANGVFTVATKKITAHRFAYKLYIGEIEDGLHVLHKCNNSLCVNPEHLYVGTHTDNMRDMAISCRAYQRKLSNQEIIDIYHSRLGSSVLAKKYEVDRCTIKRIRSGAAHKHLTGHKRLPKTAPPAAPYPP